MERYEVLNVLAAPADMAVGLVMKSARMAGAYEPIRSWMVKLIKDNMLSGFKKKFDLEVIGAENTPAEEGAILASNHQSWLDAQVLGASSERYIHFIAKSEFTEWPLLSKFIELTEGVFIKRGGDAGGVMDIVRHLRDGWLVGIFPEGSIPGEEDIGRDQLEPDTGLLKGHTGMVRMAIEAGVPIIPVGISGTGKAFPPEAYPRLETPPIQKQVPITIRYGKPIRFKETDMSTVDRDTLRTYTDQVMKKISNLVDHHRCFIPVEIPIKKPDLRGLSSLPKVAGKTKKPFGVLVLHGFTSHLNCVSGLEPFLKEMKLPYRFPILKGHGTAPHDMVGVGARDWYEDAEKALYEVYKHCEKVVVCGLSMGGLLSIELGVNHPDKISNVALVAPCLKFADPLCNFTPALAKVFKFWDSPNSFLDQELKEKRNRNYPVFATDAFASLFEYAKTMSGRLAEFNRPVLILQGKNDTVVAPKSARLIYKSISTHAASRKLLEYDDCGHEMLLDAKADKVIADIVDYIRKITQVE